jgi:hypothetical protein
METLKTVSIHLVVQAKIPTGIDTRTLGMGIAGSKIHDHCKTIPDAEISTWWVESVTPCHSQYITCPRCHNVELLSGDFVLLDGKPLCLFCTSEFQHGDAPVPRTAEQLKQQMTPRSAK